MKSTETTRSRPSGSRKKSLRDRLRPDTDVPTKHGYFRSFDGTKLFYSIEGEGKPLVFCYGLVCSSLHWTYQIEHFRKGYRTIWMDYRGHQNSDVPADIDSLNLESLAKDLAALALKFDRNRKSGETSGPVAIEGEYLETVLVK